MSSVTRFIRQNQPSTMFYNAADIVTNRATVAFEFIPTADNVVGNYPPGYMATNVTALNTLIAQAAAAGPVVLRDMGKTIQAPKDSLTGVVSFYRQVQLISLLASAVGGVQGSPSSPDTNTDYLTFYIPITVGGSAQAAAVYIHAACQM